MGPVAGRRRPDLGRVSFEPMSSARDDDAARDLPAALHEVGNALTVVVGWIDLALAALPVGSPATDALEVARGRAARAQRLARRAIGAERDLDPPRPIVDIVREVARGVEGARSGSVSVHTAIDDDLRGDRLTRGDGAGQVLTNLVLNAVEVSETGDAVRVAVRRDGDDFVVLSVTDDGPGVPAELRDALFTSGRTSRPGGAGIGLRHASMLAAEVGGALVLGEPGEVGATGAVFELRWPLALRPSTFGLDLPDDASDGASPPWPPGAALRSDSSIPPASAARVRLDGVRLLLVEDDEAVVDLLETALAARGALVEVARDLPALHGALSLAPFDVALVDLSPLGEDVGRALGDVRAHSARARLVVISGSVAFSTDVPHVDAWVRKPFEVEDVLRALSAPHAPMSRRDDGP